MSRRLQYAVPSALLAAALLVRASGSGAVELLRLKVFDAFQRACPRVYKDAGVRVIDVDEESLAKLGAWPWPRALTARLVDGLAAAGAGTITFDAVFAEPDRASPESDRRLAAAFKKTRVVAGFTLSARSGGRLPALKSGLAIVGDGADDVPSYSGASANLPAIEAASEGDGSFAAAEEPDGLVRRAPLLVRVAGALYPSLALETLRVARGAQGVRVRRGGVRVADVSLPTDDEGRVWLHFSPGAEERTIPAWKFFDAKDRPRLDGMIAIVGASAPGLRDLRPTPLQAYLPGVLVHAEVVEEALLGELMRRPWWGNAAELLVLLALGAGLIALLPRLGAGACGLVALGACAAVCAACWAAFTTRHLLLDPIFPCVCALAIYAASSLIARIYAEAERDRLAELDRVKDEFVATVSHDLRGPVGSMVMIVDAVRRGLHGPLSPDQSKSLELVEGMGRKLNGFVENVLDAAKIKAGRFALEKAELSPAALAADAAEFYALSAKTKGVELSTRVEDGVPPISGDREKLEQALHNLLGNALKFTRAGGSVTLSLDRDGGAARFSVEDTGPGVAPDDLPKLFTRFERLDSKAQGAGLGLAIAKAVVDAHGGRIWAESAKGKGATFRFTIPALLKAFVLGALLASASSAGERKPVGRLEGSGKPVFLNERVATGAGERARILLDDGTVVSLGPKSAVVVDEFVYHPGRGGNLAVRVLEGLFRFVSGKIAKKDPRAEKVELPFCSIGIDGTDFGGSVDHVALYSGAITLRNAQGSLSLKPGDAAALAEGAAPALAAAARGLVQGRARVPRGCAVLLAAGAGAAADFRDCVAKAERVQFDEIAGAELVLGDHALSTTLVKKWLLAVRGRLADRKAKDWLEGEALARRAYLEHDEGAARAVEAEYGLDARQGRRLASLFY